MDFSEFPPEIRNEIYHYALVLPIPVRPTLTHRRDHLEDGSRAMIQPMITYRLRSKLDADALHNDEISLARNRDLEDYPRISIGLLRSNKAIYEEARFIVYSKNKFQFFHSTVGHHCGIHASYGREWRVFEAFLKRIGDQNANYIRFLYICFPAFVHEGREEGADPIGTQKITLRPYSLRSLILLRDKCTNLQVLEISLDHPWESIDALKRTLNNSAIEPPDAIALVKEYLQNIPACKIKITHSDNPELDNHILARIKECGWSIDFKSKTPAKQSHSYLTFGPWTSNDEAYHEWGWFEYDSDDPYPTEDDSDYEYWAIDTF
jgi:hypothetical protein